MRKRYKITLTNSRGLARAIFFSGLERPMVIAPALLDEPMLTAQGLYFLSRQECVAWLTFNYVEIEGLPESAVERRIETILDSYLFALSRRHPVLRVTSKVHEYVLRPDMSDDLHFGFDHHLTECLALDESNDDSILSVLIGDAQDPYGGDYVLVREYVEEARLAYEAALFKAFKQTVLVTTQDHEILGTGTHSLPIARLRERPLTLEEMQMCEAIAADRPGPEPDRYFVSRGVGNGFWIPKETITSTEMYDPQLLAYYFCALRDPSPIVQFKNYYNVLEFFFEESGGRAGVPPGKPEAEHLTVVLGELLQPSELAALYAKQGQEWAERVASDLRTSSGVVIAALEINGVNPIESFSRRLYAIRNACVHSKHTRRGRLEARLVPSLVEEAAIVDEIPLIQEIAARCIEKFGTQPRE